MAKRIVSMVIVAMMLLAMVPFTASADGSTIKFTISEEGFTYTIYQVATIDAETGVYTVKTSDTNVTTAMNTPGQSGANFLAALDKASNPGTEMATVTKGTDYTTPADKVGIYYAKATAWPEGFKAKKSAVIVPKYDATAKTWKYTSTGNDTVANLTLDLAANSKATSSDIDVTKGFSTSKDDHNILMTGEGDNKTRVTEQFKGQLDEQNIVYFTLEATIVGSTDQRATKYIIYDNMSKGLTYNNDAKVYYLDEQNKESAADNDFTVDKVANPATDEENEYYGGSYITVTANEATLKTGTAFYNAKKVRVVYSATVNNDAIVKSVGNPNEDGLQYKNAAGTSKDVPGKEVRVYTYIARAYKVDASNNNTALNGAKIGLFATKAQAEAGVESTAIATGVTGANGAANGYAIFKKGNNEVRLAPGSYWVRELAAPTGYNLNTKAYEVVVDKDSEAAFAQNSISITNSKSKLPQTGGEGTMMFTIIGGSLILIAGALFVVLMKKRSSK